MVEIFGHRDIYGIGSMAILVRFLSLESNG
jgi:single-stranded DNA-specific DHH superfamily exonuclease